MNQQSNHFGPQLTSSRDPAIASYLSLIPGLGQIYNLEPRKGVLFFLVGLTNLIFIVSLMASQQLVGILSAASQEFNIAPNREIAAALASLHPGSPALTMLLLLFASFIVYSMRDARDRAQLVRKNEIYAPAVMHISEATSGSYLLHAALMATLVLFAFFFLLPAPPRVQVTSIEFVNVQEQAKVKPKTQTRAEKDAIAKKDPAIKKTSTNPSPPRSENPARSQSAQARREPAPKPATQRPQETVRREVAKPVQQPAKPVQQPAPPSQTAVKPPVVRPILQPTMQHSAPAAPNPLRQPTSMSPPKSATAPIAPAPPTRTTSDPSRLLASMMPPAAVSTNNGIQTPAPQSISVKTTGAPALIASSSAPFSTNSLPQPNFSAPRENARPGGGPVPKSIGKPGGEQTSQVGPNPTGRKSNKDSSNEGELGRFTGMTPNIGRDRDKIGSDKPGVPGVRDGDNRNPIGPAGIGPQQRTAQASVDFGPYMADLQRRIKRAWIPPKTPSSKRVVMQFNISTNGELSNLRLVRSSGSGDSDNAAMRAVHNAAPFRPLPSGSPPSVDIEFTFDYNVFSGSGSLR